MAAVAVVVLAIPCAVPVRNLEFFIAYIVLHINLHGEEEASFGGHLVAGLWRRVPALSVVQHTKIGTER
eukprot:5487414-Amphidinium_carterae.1